MQQRRVLQDVIPTPKRSIRNIPLPSSRERVREKRQSDDVIREVREEFEQHGLPKMGRGTRGGSKKYFIIGGIIVLGLLIFFGANAFTHATVSVVLGSESDNVHNSFVTRTISAASSTNGITDSIISISKKGSVTLTATTTQDVETKASGTIIVFNDYSTASQKLVANTRFETSAGLIYRIAQSISVPGKTTKGSVTTPGSVTVTVTADQVGDKYNIDLSDFTIPGFTGEPQYDGIFARSKTPMTGGFSGTRPIIGNADRAAAIANLNSNLKSELDLAAQSSVPSGYILYPMASRVDYTSLTDTVSGNKVTINQEASITGFALNVDDIDRTLAASALKGYAGEPITIANLSDLTFVTDAVPSSASSSMLFTLAGPAKFVWTVDAGTFASQLAGKPKSDFTTILQGYPHINKADVSFFPFWLGSFPSDASLITIATTTSI